MVDDLIGGKWKLRIVSHIVKGDNRFSTLQKNICDITPKVLMSQLKELESSGLIVRDVIKCDPPKIVVYRLNSEYQELEKLIDRLEEFALYYGNNNGIDVSYKKVSYRHLCET